MVALQGFAGNESEWRKTNYSAQVSAGHAACTLIRREQDVFPWLGGLPIGEIKPPQLLPVRREDAELA